MRWRSGCGMAGCARCGWPMWPGPERESWRQSSPACGRGWNGRGTGVLREQGQRGGPILALVRLVQSQALSIRDVLVIGQDRPQAAYYFDLVGAYPRVECDEEQGFFD